MIPYNTGLENLVLPEYGRLIQDMVRICSQIEDRNERNILASSIVETMKSMTHEKGKMTDDRKYWDHIFLISGGALDVDYPYGRPDEQSFTSRPKKIPYSTSNFGKRHYGNILQKMVREIAATPNSPEKDACVELLATHIKKLLVINNSENISDERVFSDLEKISEGNISVGEGVFILPEFKEEKIAKSNKKKKNRQ